MFLIFFYKKFKNTTHLKKFTQMSSTTVFKFAQLLGHRAYFSRILTETWLRYVHVLWVVYYFLFLIREVKTYSDV